MHKYDGDKGNPKYNSKEFEENDYDKYVRLKKNTYQEKNYGYVDNKPVERKTVHHGDYQGEVCNSAKGANFSKAKKNNDLPFGYIGDQTKNSTVKKDPPVIILISSFDIKLLLGIC